MHARCSSGTHQALIKHERTSRVNGIIFRRLARMKSLDKVRAFSFCRNFNPRTSRYCLRQRGCTHQTGHFVMSRNEPWGYVSPSFTGCGILVHAAPVRGQIDSRARWKCSASEMPVDKNIPRLNCTIQWSAGTRIGSNLTPVYVPVINPALFSSTLISLSHVGV